jgi:L-alanine-DL-glutamate epimerase-like enolase superfamily enzyme
MDFHPADRIQSGFAPPKVAEIRNELSFVDRRTLRGSTASIRFAFRWPGGHSSRVRLKFRRFDLKLKYTWHIASAGGGTTDCPVIFVELLDDQGRAGLGEAASTDRYQQPPDVIEAFLAKVNPSRLSFDDVAGSMRYLDSVAPASDAAKCGLNIALLDGLTRAKRIALCHSFQLGFTEGRHVTSFSIGIDTPGMVREKVREADAFPVLKLKVGGPHDKANFAALRSVAPTRPVRVDANEAWKTREEALENIEWLHRDGHVQFVEQPMPASSNREDLAWLKERSPLPVFADESYHHAADVALAAECFHGVNVKLVKAGGISGAHAALTAARSAGLKTMIGCMIESSVLITAAAHLAELTDHLDLDGNLLVSNDPYLGVTAPGGIVSFASAPEVYGHRVGAR